MSSRNIEKIERIIRDTSLLNDPFNSRLMYDLIMAVGSDKSDSSSARQRSKQAIRFKDALVSQATQNFTAEGLRRSEFIQTQLYYQFWARQSDGNLLKFFDVLLCAVMSFPRPTNSQELQGCYRQYGVVYGVFLNMHGVTELNHGRHGKVSAPVQPTSGCKRLYELAAENDQALALVRGIYHFCLLLGTALSTRWYKVDAAAVPTIEWECPESGEMGWNRLVEELSLEANAYQIPNSMHRLVGKLDEVVLLGSLLWEEIGERQRCLLRTGGRDSFKVTGAGRTDITYRYFLPEVRTDLGVTVIYARETQWGTYWEIDAISPKQLASSIESDFWKGRETPRNSSTLTALANTLAYRRIVCSPPTSSRKQYERLREIFAKEGEATETVRAHFRRLQPGWSPSPEAVELALAKFGSLPEGHTFVDEFTRVPAERPHPTCEEQESRPRPEPLFELREEDIFSWLE